MISQAASHHPSKIEMTCGQAERVVSLVRETGHAAEESNGTHRLDLRNKRVRVADGSQSPCNFSAFSYYEIKLHST